MTAIRALAGWEFRAAVRSRWILGTAVTFGGLALALTVLGLASARELGLSGAGPAASSLVNLGVLVPSVMGLLLGAGHLAGARENGMLGMLGAQPVRRRSLALGAFGGLTLSLWTTIGIGFAVTSLVLSGVADASQIGPLLVLIVATLAVGATSVAIGLGISSVAASRAQALALAIVAWIVFAFGIDLALAALAPVLHLGSVGLLVAIMINPLESARVLALLAMRPEGTALGPFGAFLRDSIGTGGTAVLLICSLGTWTAGSLALATRMLSRRDL